MIWAYTLQLLSCWFMFGVIWLVQLIVYPAFSSVEPSAFKEAHSRHSFRITFLVGPAMVIELITALMLFYFQPSWFWGLNLSGVLALWLLTGLVSVPLHNRLQQGFDVATIERLTNTNWPRTIIWTLRAALLPIFIHG